MVGWLFACIKPARADVSHSHLRSKINFVRVSTKHQLGLRSHHDVREPSLTGAALHPEDMTLGKGK